MKIFKTKKSQTQTTPEIAPAFGNLDNYPKVEVEDPKLIAERAGLKGEHFDKAVAFLEEADRIDQGIDQEPVTQILGASATEQVAEVKIIPFDHGLDQHQVEAISSTLNDVALHN